TADVVVQRVRHDLLHAIALDRLALQALDQNGRRIHEARRAITALKAVMLKKGLLYRRHAGCAVLAARFGMSLDRADASAGKKPHPCDAAAYRCAVTVILVENDRAGVAYALSATQLGAGEVGVLMQQVDHHQTLGHFD